jgi:hypothetical protein
LGVEGGGASNFFLSIYTCGMMLAFSWATLLVIYIEGTRGVRHRIFFTADTRSVHGGIRLVDVIGDMW